jgi:hypothetical protein
MKINDDSNLLKNENENLLRVNKQLKEDIEILRKKLETIKR